MTDYTEEFKNWLESLFGEYLDSLKENNPDEYKKYYRDEEFKFYRIDQLKAMNIGNEYAFVISTPAGGYSQTLINIGHENLRKELRFDCAIFGKDRDLIFRIIEVIKDKVLEKSLYPFADISVVKFISYEERAEETHNVFIPVLTFECTAFFTS